MNFGVVGDRFPDVAHPRPRFCYLRLQALKRKADR
jgi:hypothetical protein